MEYEYLVMLLDKTKSLHGTEGFLRDVVDKINDLQYHYKLTTIVCDETRVFIILWSEALKIINTDLEISAG